MTIKFIDLYNSITGQAWSMFDGEVEAQDEFETSVTTSIQKALSELWCSFKFPFRNKTYTFKTKTGKESYVAPNGNIAQKTINHKKVYGVKYNKTYLKYEPNYETLESAAGEPEYFYVKNDNIYLYPTPDDVYKIEIEYWTIFAAKDNRGISKANLENENDYIDIPEKYEDLFKNALLPLAMTYLIASESDENYSDYVRQYKKAYMRLIDLATGIDKEKRIMM